MKQLQKLYPHLLAIIGFIVISLVYFYPILQGKKIIQSDIVQYTGMAKEQNDFRAQYNTEPYWSNSAFGGMPTYQMGANYPNDYIGKLDDMLRFLPRPADYLFLYFLGFYILLLVLKTDPLKAFFGALAFGFSTYMIVILGVGHNAKAHAIGYMPLVVAGFMLVFRRRYIIGGILTMLAVALEISANHFQVTYYLLFLLLALGIYFIYKIIKENDLKSLPKIAGTFAVAVILAIGANASNLLATKEYTDFSMRGKSELTFKADGSKNNESSSMSKEYINQYSYGIAESLDLIAPRLFGGASHEKISTDSNLYEFAINHGVPEADAKEFVESAPTYWGNQPMVAAPAYIGAIVFFLCVLALFHDKRKIKWAFLAGALLTLMLSWGKNFSAVTDLFIDYVPLYDKFRGVSSIQVIVELCIPVLAIMGLQSFFKNTENQKKSLLYTAATSIGLIAVLFLMKGAFSFTSENDSYYLQSYGPDFVDALKADRANLYSADLLRSGFLMLVTFGTLWFFLKDKLQQTTATIIIGVFMVGELFFIAKNYVNNNPNQFASAYKVDQPFDPTPADEKIQEDKSIFRVYELDRRLEGRTSFFHKAVGGYSAVRPRRYEQLFDYIVDKNLDESQKLMLSDSSVIDVPRLIDLNTFTFSKSIPVLNALNVKYLIVSIAGNQIPITNQYANGNAWFVSKIQRVSSADDEIKALTAIKDTKNEVIINETEFGALLKESKSVFVKDSLAAIKLNEYKSNYIKYSSNNDNDGFAIFSETYYKDGWKAIIDGKEIPILRVDYVLRGIQVPAGKHTIEFKFEPQVVKTGSTVALISFIVMVLVIIAGVYFDNRKKT